MKYTDKYGNIVTTYQDSSAPVAGIIEAYAGSAVPSGWLLCDGQEVSQTVYAQLFARISSTYNTQTNPTTGSAWAAPSAGNFRVPDLRGLFLRGVGLPLNGSAVSLGGFQDDQLQGHAHNLKTGYGAASGDRPATTQNGAATTNDTVSGGAGTISTDGTNGTPRVGTETRGKNRGVNYIIKCFDPTNVVIGAGISATGPSLVPKYEEFDLATSASGPFAPSVITVKFVKVGKTVTMSMPRFFFTGNNTASPINFSIAIPTRFIPANNAATQYTPVFVTNNGSDQPTPAAFLINTAGVMTITLTLATSSFGPTVSNVGVYGFDKSWVSAT